jgi:hypothetical protein
MFGSQKGCVGPDHEPVTAVASLQLVAAASECLEGHACHGTSLLQLPHQSVVADSYVG